MWTNVDHVFQVCAACTAVLRRGRSCTARPCQLNCRCHLVSSVAVGRSGVVQLQLLLAVAGAQGRVCLLSLIVGRQRPGAEVRG